MDYLNDIGFKSSKCDGVVEMVEGSMNLCFSGSNTPPPDYNETKFYYHTVSLSKLFDILPKSVNDYRLMVMMMPDGYYKVGYFDSAYKPLYFLMSRTLIDGLYLVLLYLIEEHKVDNLIMKDKR